MIDLEIKTKLKERDAFYTCGNFVVIDSRFKYHICFYIIASMCTYMCIYIYIYIYMCIRAFPAMYIFWCQCEVSDIFTALVYMYMTMSLVS